MLLSRTFLDNRRTAFALVVVVALLSQAAANFPTAPGEDGGAGPFAITAVLSIAVAAWAFERLLPRLHDAHTAGRAALVLSGLALILTPHAYWSGLPQVLAPAGILLGLHASGRSGGAAVGLGVLGYAGALALCLIG